MKIACIPVCAALLSAPAWAEPLSVPGLSPADESALPWQSDCANIPGSQENCSRVLACIGDRGLWFDGGAYGWDAGTVIGATSHGVPCAGTWASGGFMGTGRGAMICEDGLEITVIYYSQDGETGTVIGSGFDSEGRRIQVWSGENVLRYLTPENKPSPELPCSKDPILIS